MDIRRSIAKNAAKYLKDGMLVNLGVGIPTLIGEFADKDIDYDLQCEGGFCGKELQLKAPWRSGIQDVKEISKKMRELGDEQGHSWKNGHRDLVDANLELIQFEAGAAVFDSLTSFAMIRGGHIDMTVLGAYQVDSFGNLANWMIPGSRLNGMGGAMDLAGGARYVVVTMEHCLKNGAPKILEKCTLPITALACVDVLVTEKCVIEFIDGKMTVVAISPYETKESVQAATGARLVFAEALGTMDMVD